MLDEPGEKPRQPEIMVAMVRPDTPRACSCGHGAAQLLSIELVQSDAGVQGKELLDGTPIVARGPGGEPPLMRELIEEFFEQTLAGSRVIPPAAAREISAAPRSPDRPCA